MKNRSPKKVTGPCDGCEHLGRRGKAKKSYIGLNGAKTNVCDRCHKDAMEIHRVMKETNDDL